ncbi:MAG: adenylate kinase [Ardenticatenales bacterium]
MIVILLGAPGSGKGTQSERLVEALDLVHISSGDLFRDHLGRGTALGTLARGYMDSGALVPDEVTIGMIADRLSTSDVCGRVLFDGFPRTVGQANALDELLSSLHMGSVAAAIFLDVDDDQVTARMVGRGRSDDNLDTIRARLATFRRDTEPVVAFYASQGKLHTVDGEGSVDEVAERIMQVLALA